MIDTLVIVGNGFDRWQGLDTSYSNFQKYYLEHHSAILKELKINPIKVIHPDGTKVTISPVELVYGGLDGFCELDDTFWTTFESSLSQIPDEEINLFFGKSKKNLKDLKKCVRNAQRILKKAFSDWIATIKIDERPSKYKFDESILFINFNYTDTLIKRFGVNPDNEYHIHGEATDPESIVVGHSDHPEYPFPLLKQLGGRFEGLYYIDEILYDTDKHVGDNIQELMYFLAFHSTFAEEIKNIYVVGSSLGQPDLGYFAFLMSCSQVNYGEQNATEDIEVDATMQRYFEEQHERDKIYQEMFMKEIGATQEQIDNYVPHAPRTEDATWHISCYSPKDKEHVTQVMEMFGCKNYRLYSTIDECLEKFRN